MQKNTWPIQKSFANHQNPPPSSFIINGCDKDEDNDDQDDDDGIDDGDDHSGCTDADEQLSFALIYNTSFQPHNGGSPTCLPWSSQVTDISYHTLSDFIFFVHPLIPNYKL